MSFLDLFILFTYLRLYEEYCSSLFVECFLSIAFFSRFSTNRELTPAENRLYFHLCKTLFPLCKITMVRRISRNASPHTQLIKHGIWSFQIRLKHWDGIHLAFFFIFIIISRSKDIRQLWKDQGRCDLCLLQLTF